MHKRQAPIEVKGVGAVAFEYVTSALLGALLFGLALTGFAIWTVNETQWTAFPGHSSRATADLAVQSACATDCSVGACQAACEASPVCRGFLLEGGACRYRGGEGQSYDDLLWDQQVDVDATLHVFDRQPWRTRALRVGEQTFALMWVKLVRLPSYIICFQGCDGSVALAGELFGVYLFAYVLYVVGDGLLYVRRWACSPGSSAMV